MVKHKYGEILFGKLIDTKEGLGKAKDILTIGYIAENNLGEITIREIQFWNTEKDKLSDKIRRLPKDTFILLSASKVKGSEEYACNTLRLNGKLTITNTNDEKETFFIGKCSTINTYQSCVKAIFNVPFIVDNQIINRKYVSVFYKNVAQNAIKFMFKDGRYCLSMKGEPVYKEWKEDKYYEMSNPFFFFAPNYNKCNQAYEEWKGKKKERYKCNA